MHRSGTSAVAGALRRAGLFAGNDGALMAPLSENPAGFTERLDVTALNDRLLHSLGWTWDAPDPDPPATPPDRPDFIEEGRRLVEAHLAGPQPWVLKDPRISVLLPWWRQILLDRFVAVVCLRPPAEVAWSLSVRNGFPLELGLALWGAYHRHLGAGLEGLPVVALDYVSLAQDAERILPDLFSALIDLGVPAAFDTGAAQASIEPTLRRATHPARLLPDGRLPETIERLQQLWSIGPVDARKHFSIETQRSASWEAALVATHRRARVEEREKLSSRTANQQLRGSVERLQQDLAERSTEIEQLQSTLAERAAEIKRLQETVAEREADAQRFQHSLADRAAKIKRLQETVAEREADAQRFQHSLVERSTEIERLQSTLAERGGETERLAAAVTEREADIERLQSALAERGSEIEHLTSVVRSTKAAAQAHEVEIKRALGELALIEHRAQALHEALLLTRRYRWRSFFSRVRYIGLRLLWKLPFGWTNPLLDVEWYLSRYPDVRQRGVSAQRHYRRHGAREGRDPNPLFDTDWYIASNPDVAASGINPLDHYLRFGAREARDPSPSFDTDWYLAQNPDVEVLGLNPLLHYLEYGAAEGRLPRPPSLLQPAGTAETSIGNEATTHQRLPLERVRPNAATLPTSLSRTQMLELPAARSAPLDKRRTPADALAQSRLSAFLVSNHRLRFPRHQRPSASVVIPTYGQAYLTYLALEALLANSEDTAFELIVVDNGSQDETRDLLGRLDNVDVILNEDNLGFGRACTIGADASRASAVCFLNSDTMVTPGWLSSLIAMFEQFPRCGAAGSKLVFPDGRLQEAGSIVWRDGSGHGYGRDANPSDPEYNYVRAVDYCSAASLLVRADAFNKVGGFDPRYAPAYYEDVDLCLALWDAGYTVMYQPRSVVFHTEFGSSGSGPAIALQQRNRERFVAKWQGTLAKQSDPSQLSLYAARDRRTGRRVLVVDDRIPAAALGSGFPRTKALLTALCENDYVVTYLPVLDQTRLEPETTALEELGIEVLYGSAEIEARLAPRADLYQAAIVSRPHNARFIDAIKRFNPGAAIVYDAEAVFAIRDKLQAEIVGEPLTPEAARSQMESELELARPADAIMTVTDLEAEHFRARYNGRPIFVWGTSIDTDEGSLPFDNRDGLLFVGNLATPPNSDAMSHFLDTAFPAIHARLGCRITIVGADPTPALYASAARHAHSAHLTGAVDDLAPFYHQARVFVAPHRFAAGLPLKVVEAMANGVPCVVSPLLAEQLQIGSGTEALVAGTPEEFAEATISLYTDGKLWGRVQEAGLEFVRRRYRREKARDTLRTCIETAIAVRDGLAEPSGLAADARAG
ncbi:MAG TPA: glycosyltransferase [Vicinamibacterales bacterium]|nr:glycosyltransferase [Vicinamibacterales bacterium]